MIKRLTENFQDDERYEYIKSKTVLDSDGWRTDYTMYYDWEDDKFIFIFGDNDLYDPTNESPDWECDTEEEANEWFDDYTGFDDEEEDFDECYLSETNNNTEEQELAEFLDWLKQEKIPVTDVNKKFKMIHIQNPDDLDMASWYLHDRDYFKKLADFGWTVGAPSPAGKKVAKALKMESKKFSCRTIKESDDELICVKYKGDKESLEALKDCALSLGDSIKDYISKGYLIICTDEYHLDELNDDAKELGLSKGTKVKESCKESVYTDAGFKNRKDYLKSLADDYGVDYNIVAELAYMLGPDEDFDALVTEIEDLVDDYDDVDNPWELERYLRTANYVVYDDKSDESHFYIAPFDNFEDAGYDVARNITQYTSSSWLYTTRNHTRTYYDADRLNTSNLIVGRFYADEAEPSDYIDYDLYDNAEDVIENVRNILDMCEVKTEKYKELGICENTEYTYRVWYRPYGLDGDEEDYIDVTASNEDEARRFARTCGNTTDVELLESNETDDRPPRKYFPLDRTYMNEFVDEMTQYFDGRTYADDKELFDVLNNILGYPYSSYRYPNVVEINDDDHTGPFFLRIAEDSNGRIYVDEVYW